MIACSVRIYALLPNAPQGARPGGRFDVAVEEGTTLTQLIERVLALPPCFVVVAAVNGQVSSLDCVIQHLDRVDLFPPLAGG